jgi:mersacidin/lichenicidin family type 2 lantibiotic
MDWIHPPSPVFDRVAIVNNPNSIRRLVVSEEDIIRAWNDEEYRSTLSDEEKAKLPPNPAGEIELTDEDLAQIQGGLDPGTTITTIFTIGVTPCPPTDGN